MKVGDIFTKIRKVERIQHKLGNEEKFDEEDLKDIDDILWEYILLLM